MPIRFPRRSFDHAIPAIPVINRLRFRCLGAHSEVGLAAAAYVKAASRTASIISMSTVRRSAPPWSCGRTL